MIIGKRKTELYLQIVKMIESGKSQREIRMTTGAADNYVARIRKSLKEK